MDPYVKDGSAVDPTAVRPVTDRSRITRRTQVVREDSDVELGVVPMQRIDWGAVVASVVTGVATTTMLIILGVATGLIAGNEDTSTGDAAGILSAIGAWAVIAAIIGAFAGSFLGGRLARWLDRGSLAYHAVTSWGVATLLSLTLLALVSIGFAASATSVATADVAANAGDATSQEDGSAPASNEPDATGGDAAAADKADAAGDGKADTSAEQAADNAGDTLGGAGLALTLAMLLTMVASFAGWWIGSRKRLTDFEREESPTTA